MLDLISIGVVTYHARFDKYFNPLIKRLKFLFPDIDINIIINGHYDKLKQIEYLKKVTAFLSSYKNLKYITHFEHQPLSRAWNQILMLSSKPFVLILNDDVFPLIEFRYNLLKIKTDYELFSINDSWSHFVINKDIIKKVGWFDENYIGIGDEDYDYMFRLVINRINWGNIKIHGITNIIAPALDSTFADISKIVDNKYSLSNREYFNKKWKSSRFEKYSSPDYYLLKRNEDEIKFYPRIPLNGSIDLLPSLDANKNNIIINNNLKTIIVNLISWLHSFYWKMRIKYSPIIKSIIKYGS